MGTSKLLLGIGIGAIVGSLATCLAKSAKGRKMRRDIHCALQEIEEDASDILYSAKDRVESASADIVNKVTGKINYVKGRVDERLHEMSKSDKSQTPE